MATRKYEQTVRADAAERTRRQILDAVYVCLRAEPSTPLSLDKVARQAGVARSTIYVIFESRAGLFEAVNTDLLERGRFERVLEAVEHPDALEHLRRGVRA